MFARVLYVIMKYIRTMLDFTDLVCLQQVLTRVSVVYKQGTSLNYFARPSSMRITNAIYDVIHFLLKKKKNTGKASSYFCISQY